MLIVQMYLERITDMDSVSSLADKSNDFASFLTVSNSDTAVPIF